MLEPGQNIRPVMTEEQAIQLVSDLYSFKVEKIFEQISYDDKNYKVSVQPEHNNPHVTTPCSHGYTLKVLNSMDSKTNQVDAEHEAMAILNKAGLNVPQPVKDVDGRLWSLQKIHYKDLQPRENNNNPSLQPASGVHCVRLLTYVPGTIMPQAPITPRLLHQLGACIARVVTAFKDFPQERMKKVTNRWAMETIPTLRELLHVIKDPDHHRLAADVITDFEKHVSSKQHTFQQGVIHGDFNEQNILVTSQPVPVADSPHVEHDICGIIDFGDMNRAAYIYELAIAITYMMMLERKVVDWMDVGGHVLAGYLSSGQMTITDAEFDALKLCVTARIVQSLVLGAYTSALDPSNDYVKKASLRGWQWLTMVTQTPKEKLYSAWRAVLTSYGHS